MIKKTTLVLGASPNPARYSNMAALRLILNNIKIILVGLRDGSVECNRIHNIREKILFKDIHTVTIYMNPHNQVGYEDYILDLNPERIIFNPGTENEKLAIRARGKGILVDFNCTLVMLDNGCY